LKNFLFAGSHDAAQKAAIIYSLVSIAKMKPSLRYSSKSFIHPDFLK
jgi:hypothetical protein